MILTVQSWGGTNDAIPLGAGMLLGDGRKLVPQHQLLSKIIPGRLTRGGGGRTGRQAGGKAWAAAEDDMVRGGRAQASKAAVDRACRWMSRTGHFDTHRDKKNQKGMIAVYRPSRRRQSGTVTEKGGNLGIQLFLQFGDAALGLHFLVSKLLQVQGLYVAQLLDGR